MENTMQLAAPPITALLPAPEVDAWAAAEPEQLDDSVLVDSADDWLVDIEHGPRSKWEHKTPTIKNKYYCGTSIRKRILATLGGGDEGFCVHEKLKHEGCATDTVFFNTNSIKVHHTVYSHNKHHGGVYKRKGDSYVLKIYFAPKVRVIRACAGCVVEESYNSLHKIEGLVAKYARIYLKHFGHEATTLRGAILPTLGSHIRLGEGELYKKHWRQPSFKATLKAAGLPHSKSLTRAYTAVTSISLRPRRDRFLNIPPEPINTIATITYLRVLWYICKDVNILRRAIYKGQSTEVCGAYNPLSVRALNSMLKPFTKRERVALANYVIDEVRVGVKSRRLMLADDIFRLAKVVYEEYGVVNITARGGEEVHNELSRVCATIRNPELNQTIEYTEEELKVDKYRLPLDAYTLHLPKVGTDVVDMGTALHNCLSGYAGTAVRRKCTIIALHKDGELFGAMEVRGRRLIQVSTHSNSAVAVEVKDSIKTALKQLSIIE